MKHTADAPVPPTSQEPEAGQTWEPGCKFPRHTPSDFWQTGSVS